MNTQPIGILDSGVGGLTVLKEIIKELPQENLIYIGDSLNTPYGAKKPEIIYRLAKRLIDFLLQKDVKLIVVACNTITVTCLDKLRIDYPQIPIIGIVPAVKTAAAYTKKKKIGILATTRTAESKYQRNLVSEFVHDCVVVNIGTDELVPLIEKGHISGEKIQQSLQKILNPFLSEDIDVLALGCTHFPLVEDHIRTIVGPDILVLNSGDVVARHVAHILESNNINSSFENPRYQIFMTGNTTIAKELVDSLLPDKPLIHQNLIFVNLSLKKKKL